MKVIRLRRGFTEIQKVFTLIQGLGFIAGGYARYCASPKGSPFPTRDLDIFPYREDYGFEELKKKFTDLGFKVHHENDVSYTFSSNHPEGYEECPTIQLIKPNKNGRLLTYGNPEEILSNFDFTVTRAAIISQSEVLVDDDFEQDELQDKLAIKNIHCPVSSLMRANKYSRKGYYLRPVEALKLFRDWDERDADYKQKLIDFLLVADKYDPNDPTSSPLTREDVEELEKLMMID